jgi:hypothetical protein
MKNCMTFLLSNISEVSDDSVKSMLHPVYPISMLNLKPPKERLKA